MDDVPMEPVIVLLGPPGSGKGTQGKRLGHTTLPTGDLLREAIAGGTDLGRRAQEYAERGDLVPDDVVAGVLRDALAEIGGGAVVLDGFPRTVDQAERLQRMLGEHGRRLSAALLIDVPDDEVVERISRRQDGRADDDPGTVRNRLRVYHERTEPLIAFYDDRGLLRRVDGTGDPDEVAERVRRSLA
jgi:adenylate kinase